MIPFFHPGQLQSSKQCIGFSLNRWSFLDGPRLNFNRYTEVVSSDNSDSGKVVWCCNIHIQFDRTQRRGWPMLYTETRLNSARQKLKKVHGPCCVWGGWISECPRWNYGKMNCFSTAKFLPKLKPWEVIPAPVASNHREDWRV